jgi:undecaprenyl-diphosphatase
VDRDLILLGVYYVVVIGAFFLFEIFPVNYRPILIEGRLEASYPSSTTLLVLSVMPTLTFQIDRRCKSEELKWIVRILTALFSAFMVVGRLICGVHWFTDIVGGLVLSTGLFLLYKAMVQIFGEEKNGTR